MDRAPHTGAHEQKHTDQRAADDRPPGAGFPGFGETAGRLLDNGYAPLPIRPGQKRPAITRWTTIDIDADRIATWERQHAGCGTGLRTGALVGVDIDLMDPDMAHRAFDLAERRLGSTLLRVGQWPKRLLIYRTDSPFAKMNVPGVEILGTGQQFVAFGLHPGTGKPYSWPSGDTPLDVPFDALPVITEAEAAAYLAEVSAILSGQPGNDTRRQRRTRSVDPASPPRPERDASGKVVDGRDSWISILAFHAVHDALLLDPDPDPEALADQVWARFAETTDLDRPKSTSAHRYARTDALRKVREKLRLHADGRLPPRESNNVEADYMVPDKDAQSARMGLDATFAEACDAIFDHHARGGKAPRIGIRASVGLGKSAASRRHLAKLRDRLRSAGAPYRIAVFTPSHALAEETAAAWRAAGLKAVVHRGYEAQDPSTGEPVCRDPDMVRSALAAGMDIQTSVCQSKSGARCVFFDVCAKQANRREVAAADVIVAPYDALFTGFPVSPDSLGLLLIDEACWPRAIRETGGLYLETLRGASFAGLERFGQKISTAARMADLDDLRAQVIRALTSGGPGWIDAGSLRAEGLDEEACLAALRLEEMRLADPDFIPGMAGKARETAMAIAASNADIRRIMALWRALARVVRSGEKGRLRVEPRKVASGLSEIFVSEIATLHSNFRDLPVLHLDATFRPEIVNRVLPELELHEIEADMPHQLVTLVQGRFGKSALMSSSRAKPEENARRSQRLADVVTYVHWQILATEAKRTLVVTYKDIEEAFRHLPGVVVAHFNAIAGLDAFGDVDLLIVIGRPLPAASDLERMAGALFGAAVSGRYRRGVTGVRMRSGDSRAVQVIGHDHEEAELLRKACCDDELVQAIGRGRGVNRTQDNPLSIHVLADVALPVVHDTVTSWDIVAPDEFQKMLLAGVAVDSPQDAAALHPSLFADANQAKMIFQRRFKGHFSYKNPIRRLTHKSGRYRRAGRGRGWQTCWWIEGTAQEVQARLQDVLGPLAGFSEL